LEANRHRDIVTIHALADLGWRSHVVWECELEHPETVMARVLEFLDDGNESA